MEEIIKKQCLTNLDKFIYATNIDEWELLFEQKLIVEKTPLITQINIGYFLPVKRNKDLDSKFAGIHYEGGCVDQQMNFVGGVVRNKKLSSSHTVYGIYKFDQNKVQTINEKVIFGGIIDNHFGHFILDCLSRLWFKLDERSNNLKWAFIPIKSNVIPAFFFNFLEFIGINREDIIIVNDIVSYSEILVPEQSITSFQSCYPIHYKIYEAIAKHTQNFKKDKIIKKIYLTRTALNEKASNKIIGEQYFESFYKNQGFEIISPENFPLSEQISLVANCDELVCTLGTLSHFVLFMKEKSKITILTRAKSVLKPQAILLKLMKEYKDISFNIIDVSMNFINDSRNQGISLIGPTKEWKNFVKENYNIILNDNFSGSSIIDYLKNFYEIYKELPKYSDLKDLSFFNILDNLALILDGKHLDKSTYSVKTKYELLEEERNFYKLENSILKHKIESLSNTFHAILKTPTICSKYHCSNIGWLDFKFIDERCLNDSLQRIEAFILKSNEINPIIEYSSYNNDNGWVDWCSEGQVCGTIGKKLPIRSFKCRSVSDMYILKYRFLDNTKQWSRWFYEEDFLPIDHKNEIFLIEIIIETKLN